MSEMNWSGRKLMELCSWLRAMTGRGRLEREMDAELAFHLEAVTAEEPTEDEDGGAVFDASGMGADGGGDLFQQAVAIVKRDRKASTSYIQRRLQIGYNRAASLMERMELEGIVGPANHAGKREILVGEEEGQF